MSVSDARSNRNRGLLGALDLLAAKKAAPSPLQTPAPVATGSDRVAAKLRTILTPGMEGPDVADFQTKLITLELLKGPATGVFDKATTEAVKAFQKSVAIEINGRVGPYTLGKLTDAVAVYGPGSQGGGVKILQDQLRKLGYLKADATGLFDDATAKAVIAFETEHRLEISGKAGPETRQFIAEAMAEATEIDARYARYQDLLARAIAAEARGEPFDAKVAVAQTILNYSRMHEVSLPRLVRSSYLSSNGDGNRRFYTMAADRIGNWEECTKAAQEALAGRGRVGSRSYFTDDSIGPPSWVDRKSAMQIGHMVYYRGRTE